MSNRNVMNIKQKTDLTIWISQNKESLDGKSVVVNLRAAEKALEFKIPRSSFTAHCDAVGVKPKEKKDKSLKEPTYEWKLRVDHLERRIEALEELISTL